MPNDPTLKTLTPFQISWLLECIHKDWRQKDENLSADHVGRQDNANEKTTAYGLEKGEFTEFSKRLRRTVAEKESGDK